MIRFGRPEHWAVIMMISSYPPKDLNPAHCEVMETGLSVDLCNSMYSFDVDSVNARKVLLNTANLGGIVSIHIPISESSKSDHATHHFEAQIVISQNVSFSDSKWT